MSAHGYTINGRLSGELEDDAKVRDVLSRMNGQRPFAISLWQIPGGDIDGFDHATGPTDYLQSAGSANAMSIEIHTTSGDAGQFAVGRGGDHAGEPTIEIAYQEHAVTVYEDEVFDHLEAAQVYGHYRAHGTVPDAYSLRRLEI